MAADDDTILELTGPLFDGLYEFYRRAPHDRDGARMTTHARRPAHAAAAHPGAT